MRCILIWIHILAVCQCIKDKQVQPGYGYIGPACAVVDGMLFLHGVAKRVLSADEIAAFALYQTQLTKFKNYRDDLQSADAPLVPAFCGIQDDSLEVVLSKCIVRNNHVYIDDKLIRSLSNLEKQKVETMITRRAANEQRRRKRDALSRIPSSPQRDISALLHRFLNVNSTVTSRFLPVVSQSPLFSIDSPWQNILPALQHMNQMPPEVQEPDNIPTTRIESPYRPVYLTSSTASTTTKRIFTTTKSFNTATARTIHPRIFSRKPQPKKMYKNKAKTTQRPTTTSQIYTTPASIELDTIRSNQVSHHWSHEESQTVVDPAVLMMIANALESNQLLDTLRVPASSPPRTVPLFTVTPTQPPLNIQFIRGPVAPSNSYYSPQAPSIHAHAPSHALSHNMPFVPQGSITSLTGSRRYSPVEKMDRLPDEICSAHLNHTNIMPFYLL